MFLVCFKGMLLHLWMKLHCTNYDVNYILECWWIRFKCGYIIQEVVCGCLKTDNRLFWVWNF